MVRDEFVTKKLEYLEEVVDDIAYNQNDDSSKETYIKALNSAIETCRKEEQDELAKEKMKQQFEIERLKLENQLKIEEIRAEATKSSKEEKPASKLQQALEWAKVIVPTVIPIIAYGIYQERMLKFEETGTIHSKVGREMHLPKFMK